MFLTFRCGRHLDGSAHTLTFRGRDNGCSVQTGCRTAGLRSFSVSGCFDGGQQLVDRRYDQRPPANVRRDAVEPVQGHVADHMHFLQRGDMSAGVDCSFFRLQGAQEGTGTRLRASARERPSGFGRARRCIRAVKTMQRGSQRSSPRFASMIRSASTSTGSTPPRLRQSLGAAFGRWEQYDGRV